MNFELRRAAVHVAITQVDLARLRLSEPARPVQASAPGQPTQPGGQSQFGDTVARDLVNALIDLLNVQNDFLSVWVDHEVQELSLDFDLGTMELDGRGMRIEHNQPLQNVPDEPAVHGAVRRAGCVRDAAMRGGDVAAEGAVAAGRNDRSAMSRNCRGHRRRRAQVDGPALQGPMSTPAGRRVVAAAR